MNDTIRELFSDKALRQLGFRVKSKPSNKEYAKLRKRLKEYHIISWFNGTQPMYEVDYDFLEEFINCKEFMQVGHSISKFREGKYLHRISVLPLGARRMSYYKMVTNYDERMIDTNILKKD